LIVSHLIRPLLNCRQGTERFLPFTTSKATSTKRSPECSAARLVRQNRNCTKPGWSCEVFSGNRRRAS